MITLISGTNRPGSNTYRVTQAYSRVLEQLGAYHRVLSLESLPRDFAFTYLSDAQTDSFREILDSYVRPADKFISVIPEYNGSFPGIFKLFLDAIHPNDLRGKKMALVGLANGRSGNLRGIDSLTGALHYLGITVYPKNMPISLIREKMDAQGQLSDEATLKAIRMQMEGFLQF